MEQNDTSVSQNELLLALAHCTSLIVLKGGEAESRQTLLSALNGFIAATLPLPEYPQDDPQHMILQSLYAKYGGRRAFWDIFIETLPFRAFTLFTLANIHTMERLLGYSALELECYRRIGKTTVNAVIDRLKDFGLRLKS